MGKILSVQWQPLGINCTWITLFQGNTRADQHTMEIFSTSMCCYNSLFLV